MNKEEKTPEERLHEWLKMTEPYRDDAIRKATESQLTLLASSGTFLGFLVASSAFLASVGGANPILVGLVVASSVVGYLFILRFHAKRTETLRAHLEKYMDPNWSAKNYDPDADRVRADSAFNAASRSQWCVRISAILFFAVLIHFLIQNQHPNEQPIQTENKSAQVMASICRRF